MAAYFWIIALKNSLALVVGSCCVALIIGLFTSVCAWRGGHVLGRLLPLLIVAVPPYLLVFCLSEVISYVDPWILAIGVLGLCNSVFVHAPLTSYFSRQGEGFYESAYVATGSHLRASFHTIKPALRGALPIGLTIVACEALGDFAVSRYYGIQTITIVTFNAWTSSLTFARIIPGLIMMAVLGMLFAFIGKRTKDLPFATRSLEKKPIYAVIACLPTAVVLAFCFGTFIRWKSLRSSSDYVAILDALQNSAILVGFALAGCTAIALLMVRFGSHRFTVRTGLFLYSVPGIVLAALMLVVCSGWSYLIMLNVAIFMRFSCLMIVNMDAIMQSQLGFNEMLLASCSCSQRFKQKLILYSPALITGLCLVALDVLRELPMSRLLQPYNFSTLAMRVSYLSATEMLSSMAVEAMVLLSVGIFISLVMIRVQYAFSK